MESKTIQRSLRGLWTIKDVARRYGVTTMTIYYWRTRRPDDPLPAIVVPGARRPPVLFVPQEVRAWGRRNNKEVRYRERITSRPRREQQELRA